MAYSRRKWGARPPKNRVSAGAVTELFIHHSAGFGQSYETKAEQRALMRQIQRYHMDVQGWDDIGYTVVVFQPQGRFRRARVYKARGFGILPAAQGGRNSGTAAVCVVGNFDHERVKWWTRRRLRGIARKYKKRGVRRVGGHRDVTATSCPGQALYTEVMRIASRVGLARV